MEFILIAGLGFLVAGFPGAFAVFILSSIACLIPSDLK